MILLNVRSAPMLDALPLDCAGLTGAVAIAGGAPCSSSEDKDEDDVPDDDDPDVSDEELLLSSETKVIVSTM